MLDSIDELRLFSKVFETGSIRQAADSLNISAAAASKRLFSLENKLSVKLFYRTTRSISPTDSGQKLYQQVNDILRSVCQTESLFSANAQLKGTIRLTASASFSQGYLAPFLSHFLSQNPQVSIDVLATDEPVDMVERGIDVAIRHGPLRDSSLIGRHLADSGRVLCAAPGYLARHGFTDHPDALHQHSLLVVGKESSWQFRQNNISKTIRLSPRFASTLGESVYQMTLAGHGIAVLSDWHVRDALADGRLVPLLADWQIVPSISIHVLYPARDNMPLAVSTFITHLERWVKQHPI